MFLVPYSSLVATKDWNKEGILIAKGLRAFPDMGSVSRYAYWPGAFIGEASPVSQVFSMGKPFPKNPFPLTYPLPFCRPWEDNYYFYTGGEARLPGIAMHLLLKKRWSCWWPDYGENYPVLRLFGEKPIYPYRELVRIGGKATFSYDPWIHEGFRRVVDDILLNLGSFFEASATEDFYAYSDPWVGPKDTIVQQYPYRELVRIGGKATFSYDPWIHEGFRIAVDDALFSMRFWEFVHDDFREKPPTIIDFSPLLPVFSHIFPKRFSLAQILKLKEEYESQFEFYDPNIIVTRGGRPALERKIIKRFVPALKALGWNNYPSPFHLRTYGPLWKKAPFKWENYPLDYQTWRALHIEDWRIKQYFKKLKMTVKRAERYEKKKRLQESSFSAWRDSHMDEWLAFVRDDPRQNVRGAEDDIYSYKQELASWRQSHQGLRFFREF